MKALAWTAGVAAVLAAVVVLLAPWADDGSSARAASHPSTHSPDEPAGAGGALDDVADDRGPGVDGSGASGATADVAPSGVAAGDPSGDSALDAVDTARDAANTARRAAGDDAATLAIVVTSNGAPLVGATVVVAPVLRDPVWDRTAEAHSWEREQVRGAFTPSEPLARLATDGEGRCSVARAALIEVGRPVVVAALHPRAFGDLVVLDGEALAHERQCLVELAPAPAHVAVVRGAAPGAPVEVAQAALYPSDFTTVDDYTDAFVSWPLLRHVHTRSGDGEVALFPVAGRSLLVARSGDRASAPHVGALADGLALELAPRFEVAGRVVGPTGALLEGLVRVQAQVAQGGADGAWLDQAIGELLPDGSFAALPSAWRADARAWRVRAEAIDLPSVVAAFAPEPGGSYRIDLETPTITRCDAYVRDGATGLGLAGARVTLDWPGREDPPWTEVTDADGLVMFAHMPVNAPILVSVSKEGYVDEPALEYRVGVWGDLQMWRLFLWPRCETVARIEPPLPGLEVLRGEIRRAQPEWSNPRPIEVQARDGVVVFEGSGGEAGSLYLASERGSIGPFDIPQGVGRVDLGVLRLVPHRAAVVRVLDTATGEPLVGAAVQPFALDPVGLEVPCGAAVATDELGVARFERFHAGAGFVQCSRAGYTKARVVAAARSEAEAASGALLDLGDVWLAPQDVLEVELDVRPERARWFLVEERGGPGGRVHFDALGRARLPVSPQAWSFALVDPDGREELLRSAGDLGLGGDVPARLVWPVRPGRLDVRFTGASAELAARLEMHILELSWRTQQGWFDRRVPVVFHQELLPTRALPVAETGYAVRDQDGRLVTWGRAELAEHGDQEIVIDLAHGLATLRVVDGDGAPQAGVRVVGFDRRASTAPTASVVGIAATGADGRVELPLLPDGALGLSLAGPRGAVAPDVDTSAWRAGDEVEYVLAPTSALELAVVAAAGGAPLAGVVVDLRRGDDRLRITDWESGADGRIGPVPLEPATYLLEVAHAGHFPRRVWIDVAAPGVGAAELVVPPLVDLDLELVDAAGSPLRNVAVDLEHVDLGERLAEWLADGRVRGAATTDAAGRLLLGRVPAGAYRLTVAGAEVGVFEAGAEPLQLVVR